MGYRQRTAWPMPWSTSPRSSSSTRRPRPRSAPDLEIRDLIRELAAARTVIFSTHILQEVEAIADRVVIISQGEVRARGTLADLALLAGVRAFGEAEVAAPFAEVGPALEAAGFGRPELVREEGVEPRRFCARQDQPD
jgi:ABC-2 type transport system ATP-binding protein